MAIWWTALKVIPWTDVIEHAPAVLKGAKRLLDRHRTSGSAVASPAPAPGPQDPLHLHLEALRQQHAEDMGQLTRTLAELAEQNTRLVEAVDLLRWRTRWLGGGLLLLAAVVAGLMLWGG